MLVALSDDQRQEKSQHVIKHLVSCLVQLVPKLNLQDNSPSILNVGLFAPMKDEVDILEGLFGLLRGQSNGSMVFETSFPYGEQRVMSFRQCVPEELEESFQFGVKIRTPRASDPIVEPHILIIPGMAFTKSGHRLGRGKGFYDRYLENFAGLKIGVCFDEQIRKSVPYETHDQKMDFLVCESGTFDCE